MAQTLTCFNPHLSSSNQTCLSPPLIPNAFSFRSSYPLESPVLFIPLLSLALFLGLLFLFSLFLLKNWCFLHPSIRDIPYVEKPRSMPWWKFIIMGHARTANISQTLQSYHVQSIQRVPPMHQKLIFGFNMMLAEWMRNYLCIYGQDPEQCFSEALEQNELQNYRERNAIPYELISCLREKPQLSGKVSASPLVVPKSAPCAVPKFQTTTTSPAMNTFTTPTIPTFPNIPPASTASTNLNTDSSESFSPSLPAPASASSTSIPSFNHGFIRYRFYFGLVRVVPISVDAVRYILLHDGQGFEKWDLTKKLLKHMLGSKSIVFSTRHHHDRLKRIMIPAFHHLKLKRLARLFLNQAKHLSQQWSREWAQRESSASTNQLVDDPVQTKFSVQAITPHMDHTMMMLTSRVIGEAAMGFDLNLPSDNQLLSTYLDATQITTGRVAILANVFLPAPLPSLFKGNRIQWAKAARVRQAVAKLIQRRVDLRERESKQCVLESAERTHIMSRSDPDLLDYILDSRDDPQALPESVDVPNEALKLSPEEILDQAMTFMSAGQITTSATIGFILSELANQPHLQDELRHELSCVFYLDQASDLVVKPISMLDRKECRSSDPDYSERIMDQLDQLSFLDAIVKETLRLYPPIAFQIRVPTQDHVVQGKLIAAGTVIQLPFFSIQRLPLYWGPNAMVFDPHRFLSAKDRPMDEELLQFRHSLALLTFSFGTRACMGRKFSLYETKCVIARLVMQWRFSLPAEKEFLTPYAVDLEENFVTRPRGLRLNVVPIHS